MIGSLKKIVISITFLLIGVVYFGQQTRQYSQYLYSYFAINPAYAGNKDAVQFLLTERIQWVGFDGAPHNQSMQIHSPIASKNMGVGINLTNETIGAHGQIGGQISYSYSIKGAESRLSFGLRGGVYSFRVLQDKLTYQDQSDGSMLTTGTSSLVPAIDFGIHYNLKNITAGISLNNIYQSRIKLNESNIVTGLLRTHINLYGAYDYRFNERWMLRPGILVKYIEAAPISVDMSLFLVRSEKVALGVSYRTNKSIIGIVQAYITKNVRLGYAYDYYFNQVGFGGSHELVLGVDLKLKKSVLNPRFF